MANYDQELENQSQNVDIQMNKSSTNDADGGEDESHNRRLRRHVVIVGAGMAGLVCAHSLLEQSCDDDDDDNDLNGKLDLHVTLIEATSQVGGRIQANYDFCPGFPLDMGAEYITRPNSSTPKGSGAENQEADGNREDLLTQYIQEFQKMGLWLLDYDDPDQLPTTASTDESSLPPPPATLNSSSSPQRRKKTSDMPYKPNTNNDASIDAKRKRQDHSSKNQSQKSKMINHIKSRSVAPLDDDASIVVFDPDVDEETRNKEGAPETNGITVNGKVESVSATNASPKNKKPKETSFPSPVGHKKRIHQQANNNSFTEKQECENYAEDRDDTNHDNSFNNSCNHSSYNNSFNLSLGMDEHTMGNALLDHYSVDYLHNEAEEEDDEDDEEEEEEDHSGDDNSKIIMDPLLYEEIFPTAEYTHSYNSFLARRDSNKENLTESATKTRDGKLGLYYVNGELVPFQESSTVRPLSKLLHRLFHDPNLEKVEEIDPSLSIEQMFMASTATSGNGQKIITAPGNSEMSVSSSASTTAGLAPSLYKLCLASFGNAVGCTDFSDLSYSIMLLRQQQRKQQQGTDLSELSQKYRLIPPLGLHSVVEALSHLLLNDPRYKDRFTLQLNSPVTKISTTKPQKKDVLKKSSARFVGSKNKNEPLSSDMARLRVRAQTSKQQPNSFSAAGSAHIGATRGGGNEDRLLSADHVVVAVPPTILPRIMPNLLPKVKIDALKHIGYTNVCKVVLRFKQPSWPQHVQSIVSGDCLMFPELSFRSHLINGQEYHLVVFTLSAEYADEFITTCQLAGDNDESTGQRQTNQGPVDDRPVRVAPGGWKLWDRDLCVDLCLQHLALVLSLPEENLRDKFMDVLIHDWESQAWIECGQLYPRVGMTSDHLDALAAPIVVVDNEEEMRKHNQFEDGMTGTGAGGSSIHFCGDATDTNANFSIQSAVETGYRAAYEVLEQIAIEYYNDEIDDEEEEKLRHRSADMSVVVEGEDEDEDLSSKESTKVFYVGDFSDNMLGDDDEHSIEETNDSNQNLLGPASNIRSQGKTQEDDDVEETEIEVEDEEDEGEKEEEAAEDGGEEEDEDDDDDEEEYEEEEEEEEEETEEEEEEKEEVPRIDETVKTNLNISEKATKDHDSSRTKKAESGDVQEDDDAGLVDDEQQQEQDEGTKEIKAKDGDKCIEVQNINDVVVHKENSNTPSKKDSDSHSSLTDEEFDKPNAQEIEISVDPGGCMVNPRKVYDFGESTHGSEGSFSDSDEESGRDDSGIKVYRWTAKKRNKEGSDSLTKKMEDMTLANDPDNSRPQETSKDTPIITPATVAALIKQQMDVSRALAHHEEMAFTLVQAFEKRQVAVTRALMDQEQASLKMIRTLEALSNCKVTHPGEPVTLINGFNGSEDANRSKEKEELKTMRKELKSLMRILEEKDTLIVEQDDTIAQLDETVVSLKKDVNQLNESLQCKDIQLESIQAEMKILKEMQQRTLRRVVEAEQEVERTTKDLSDKDAEIERLKHQLEQVTMTEKLAATGTEHISQQYSNTEGRSYRHRRSSGTASTNNSARSQELKAAKAAREEKVKQMMNRFSDSGSGDESSYSEGVRRGGARQTAIPSVTITNNSSNYTEAPYLQKEFHKHAGTRGGESIDSTASSLTRSTTASSSTRPQQNKSSSSPPDRFGEMAKI